MKLKCQCGGAEGKHPGKCGADITQEDGLCDHCRTLQCETRTEVEMMDYTLCLRLGCPEHTIPGGPTYANLA